MGHFKEWIYTEMARGKKKKKAQKVQTPKSDNLPMVIQGTIAPAGPRQTVTGTGVHNQAKPGATGIKRQQTRNKNWTKDFKQGKFDA